MEEVNGAKGTIATSYTIFEDSHEKINHTGMRFAFYKMLLVIQDILLVEAIFVLFWWSAQHTNNVFFSYRELGICMIVGLVAIAYLPALNTYSYHLIFSKSHHISILTKAMGWGGVSLGMLSIIYTWPQLFEGVYLAPVMIVFALIILLLSRFYSDQLVNLLMALGISFLGTAALELLKTEEVPGMLSLPWEMPAAFITSACAVVVGRLFTVQVVFNKLLRKRFRRQIAIIGSANDAGEIVEHIIRYNAPFWVAGFISRQGMNCYVNSEAKPCLGDLKNLPKIVAEHQILDLIITDEQIDKTTLIEILDYCTTHNISVWFPPKLMPIIEIKLYIDSFSGLPMIRLCESHFSGLYSKLKQVSELILTSIIFLVQLPVFTAVALAIKMDSKGPVFYRAEAIGRNGKKFHMLKFRSMFVDNKSDIHKEYVTNFIKGKISAAQEGEKPLKIVDDPRVTKVGKIIRKYSLDELPQLINVIKGQMSLVGPRPCLPYEYDIYQHWHKKTNRCKTWHQRVMAGYRAK